MNSGNFNKQVTVMLYTHDAGGDFALVPQRKIWASIENVGNCVYSNYAFGVKSAKITTRVTSIPCMSFISYRDNLYIVTSAVHDGMYSTLICAKVYAQQAVAYRYVSTKDTLCRERRTLERLLSFPAVPGEKYVRPIEHMTHDETTKSVIITTPKGIDLCEGDILHINNKSYTVNACHFMDMDKNDYELELRNEN